MYGFKYKYVFLIILFDFLTKLLVSNLLYINSSVAVIKGFFNITYTKNYGAAFSILENYRFLLIVFSIIVLFVILYYLKKNNITNKFEVFSYSLILGGLVGNLIDRIFYGYVIDFFDFCLFGYDFAIFNLADVAIVVGIMILIFIGFKGDKNADKSR